MKTTRTYRIPSKQKQTPYAGGPSWLMGASTQFHGLFETASSYMRIQGLQQASFEALPAQVRNTFGFFSVVLTASSEAE
jgi:hypothetical protein